MADSDFAYDVIVYGTVALDAIWRVRQLAAPDTYEPILEERKMIGGEAANTAIALARWGVRVALVGNALGDDPDGTSLRSLFARDAPALDLRWIETQPEARTPYCACIATPDGQRTMYGTGFSEMQCPRLDPELAHRARFFTLDPNAWRPGLRAIAAAAQTPIAIVPMDYTRNAKANAVSRLLLTSHAHAGPGRPYEWLARRAAQLRDQWRRDVVITCGERGSLVAEAEAVGNAAHRVAAFVVPHMVDATGAGDIFRAGLLYGLVQEWPLREAARWASAAAALNCTAMGGWGGVRSIDEITAFANTTPTHLLST